MRRYPLCRVARSLDGQRFETLSDADARALFDELAHAWELAEATAGLGLQAWACRPLNASGSHLADAVVEKIERGDVAELRLHPATTLYLRRADAPAPAPTSGSLYATGTDGLLTR